MLNRVGMVCKDYNSIFLCNVSKSIMRFLIVLLIFYCYSCSKSSRLEYKTMTFGKYYIDSSGEKKDIEWLVIEKNNNEMTLMSKYVIDNLPYNSNGDDCTWEECSLRKWLNNEFYNMAFNEEEKNKIVAKTNTNMNNKFYDLDILGGDDTIDKVYILGVDDYLKYFKHGGLEKYGYSIDEEIVAEGTEYAYTKEINGDKLFKDEKGHTLFWARTPGHYQNTATYIDSDGLLTVYGYSVDAGIIGIRPVINIVGN